MKQTKFLLAALFSLMVCSNANAQAKKEPVKKAKPAMTDSATAMKNWQEYMTPSKVHQMMATWDGTWKTETTTWMEPGKPPMKSSGQAVNKMILNGLYQETIFTGDMMGMPFEGHGTMGYDNAKKVFVSTWVDNMGSGIMYMKGTWNAATKSITLKGKGYDPTSGKDCEMKEVFKVIDDNNQVMEMYGPNPMDGKPMKMMEIKFIRAQ
jgi:hypothetical protein